MVCISRWLRIGLSRYTDDVDGESNPVSHMAHTNTSRNGSSGSLNLEPRSSSIIRLRCLAMSSPALAASAISFWACDTTTAMSVLRMNSISDSRSGRSNSGVVANWSSSSAR